MKSSKQGIQLTQGFEACRYAAYIPRPGDKWTIGWGHTRGVHEGMTCTQEEADQWLVEDRQLCEDFLNARLGTELNQNEFDALMDFCFNCGIEAFNQSTMLKLLNKHDHEGAAHEFEKWDHAGGKVMAGLLRRRKAEEALFESPVVEQNEHLAQQE